ncbi:dihydropteroate synthase [Nitriliruptoraceae bacterium ZYF776]|nr:dihydropteroate synthase [Profundirhabdus halotolerans]
MDDGRPTCRVEDAALVDGGGPARLVLSRLPRAAEIAEKVAAARGVSRQDGDRLIVTAVPSRLVDAAGRVGGAELAALVRDVVDPAIAAWGAAAPDVVTSAGTLPSSTRPVLWGIVNVTPDSFSDGGTAYDPDDHPGAAIAAGRALREAGADVLDVGGESTRPGADPVPADEELRRVLPVVEALAADGAVVSIDTTKAAVARAAVDAGAAIVNDVSAGGADPDLWSTVAELGVPYVLMHQQGEPRTMQDDPRYVDVVSEVFDHLADGLAALASLGVPAERVLVDPGIGFGKTGAHNLALLRATRDLTSLGRPVLVGASRKSFLGKLTGVETAAERVDGSLAVAATVVGAGASHLRVHDVAQTRRVVAVAHAVAAALPGRG